MTLPTLSVILPEIVVLGMACVILLVDVLLKERLRFVTYLLTQSTMVAGFLISLNQYGHFPTEVVTFSGHYILDKLSIITKLVIFVISFFAFVYAREYTKEHRVGHGEYYTLGLLAVLGMQVMASAYSFLTIFLGLELLSLSLYAMVALQKHSVTATEAAMKYFVLGALASALLLYGISMLYGLTGSIEINPISKLLADNAQNQSIMLLSLVFVLAGVVFKFGAVPFHMWVPDVYEGAPATVTLFIASAPKVAAFAIIARIVEGVFGQYHVAWEHVLIVISVLSMFSGNLLAIAQTNIKRMLAYSSIAHIGYMLLGVIAGTDSADGYSAAMFYITTYVMVAAGAFAVIAILGKEGKEFDQLNDFRGLNARNPWLAFMMLLLMFSMAGVPPTVGFFAKLGLLEALVEAHFVWLAVLALLFAIIGAYYYLRVVMLMYFEEPDASLTETRLVVTPGVMAAVTVNSFAALALGLFPSSLIDLCRISLA